MGLFAKEVRILLLMVILGAASVVALVQYTDICRLQAVTLNGQKITHVEELGLKANRPIIQQPLDSLADVLMTRHGIVQVDIDYKLPNTLRITTNSLEPKCYILDVTAGVIYGLEETGRVVPVDYRKIDWDAPIFTGVRVKRIHDYPGDGRVNMILMQLKRIRQTHESLYRQIEEIDLSRREHALVTMANKPFRLKIRPEEFADRLMQFEDFVARYHPATDSITNFDLTYTDMIIRQGYVEPKDTVVIDTSEFNDKASLHDESELIEAPIPQVAPPRPAPHVTKTTGHRLKEKSAAELAKESPENKKIKTSSAKAGSASAKNSKTNLKAKSGYKPGKVTSTTKKKTTTKTRPSSKVTNKKPTKKASKTKKNG